MTALGFLRVSRLQVGRSSSWRRALMAFLLLVTATDTGIVDGPRLVPTFGCDKLPSMHRKLLHHWAAGGIVNMKRKLEMETNRIRGDKKRCTVSDVVISQGASIPLPDGIPTYRVEIANECGSGCDIHSIRVKCGWFSSARLVNPKMFRRLRYNECLVNDGKPLKSGTILSFQYSNTFLYPLSVASVSC